MGTGRKAVLSTLKQEQRPDLSSTLTKHCCNLGPQGVAGSSSWYPSHSHLLDSDLSTT